MEKSKLYVIVDSKLSKSQQAVQACHVVAEFFIKYSPNDNFSCTPSTIEEYWDGSIILLKTNNLEKYLLCAESKFYEPDLNNNLTAIATLENVDEFKNLMFV